MISAEVGRTTLCNTNTEVSRLALGTHKLGIKQEPRGAEALLGHAFHSGGVTLFDTSDNYGPAEKFIGAALAKGILPRDGVVIATKTGVPRSKQEASEFAQRGIKYDASPGRIRSQIEASLSIMGIETIDLYYAHIHDPRISPLETASVMNDLIREGKIRHWGVSNYNDPELVSGVVEASEDAGLIGPVAIQNFYSVIHRQLQTAVERAQELGLSVFASMPLQGGALTENTIEKIPALREYLNTLSKDSEAYTFWGEQLAIRDRLAPLQEFAADNGRNMQQLAIAWLMSQKSTIPILGAYSKEHFDDLVKAAGWKLEDEAFLLIDQVAEELRPDK